MEKHVTAVGALQIGFSVFGVFLGFFLFLLLAGIGSSVHDYEGQYILWTVGTAVGFFLVIISIPGIIGGIGLLKYKNWARILILIVAAIDLINFPFGTALGVYSIWVLVQPETAQLFNNQAPSTEV